MPTARKVGLGSPPASLATAVPSKLATKKEVVALPVTIANVWERKKPRARQAYHQLVGTVPRHGEGMPGDLGLLPKKERSVPMRFSHSDCPVGGDLSDGSWARKGGNMAQKF